VTTRRKNLFLLIASTLLTLLLAEGIARQFVSVDYLRSRYYRCIAAVHINPDTGVFDSQLGYRIRPRIDIPFATPFFSTSIRTNSEGFRDDESSLENPDFLFLGDSFTLAWGVEESEGVCSQFEDLCAKKALNIGIPGYSTIQEAMLVEEIFPSPGLGAPHVLLLVFQNDLLENSLPVYSPFPTVRKKGKKIIVTPPLEECYRLAQKTQRASLLKFCRIHSVLADFAALPMGSVTLPMIPDSEAPIDIGFEEYGHALPGSESFEYAMRYLQMVLEENSLPVHAFYIPHVDELTGRKESYSRMFESVMRQLEIPHYDFTGDLEPEDYFMVDCHWKPSGHEKAAKAMARFLGEAGIVGAGSAQEP